MNFSMSNLVQSLVLAILAYHRKMKACSIWCLAVLCCLASRSDAISVYQIGNSLTYELDRPMISAWAQSRGFSLDAGYDVNFGQGLDYHWSNPTTASAATELFSTALPNNTWDVLTLQPSFNTIEGPTGDAQRISDFVGLLTSNPANTNTQVYIYERWPWNDYFMPLYGYRALWEMPYEGNPDGHTSTRDFYAKLLDAVSGTLPLSNPVELVPIGETFYNIDAAIQAGEIPELTSITQLYRDNTHLSPIGSFTLAATFYATVFHDNPFGLANLHSADVPDDLALRLEEISWETVTHAGELPEPKSISVFALGLLISIGLMRRTLVRRAQYLHIAV
jgi:hypothetical protein